jgi:hypothetical protein
MRAVTAAVGVAVVAATVVAPAPAGPPGSWTRLPGTLDNFGEPGLARTSDGTLHVVYTRKNGTKQELAHVPVTASGKVGAASVALGGWAAMSYPDLIRMPDGSLRAFFGGIRSTNPGETNNAMNTATAPASGSPWTLQPGRAAQATYAYATSYAGAGLAKDGTPISSWAGTPGLGFHYGVSPGDPDRVIPQSGCCLYTPDIGVDASSGQAWVGFSSNENATPGLFANAIGPGGPQGSRHLAPGSTAGKSFNQQLSRTPISGRIGAGGVFIAYGQGYPSYKTLALWQVNSARPQLVVKANGMKHAGVAAAPEGRLWLMWDVSNTIYATRTNHAANRIGPVTRLRPPGSGSVYELHGEGSAGPLDLFANDGQGLWHQQVRPKLQLQASSRKAGKGRVVTFRVLDAGDPVAGATVKAGGRSLKTAANGTATLRQARAAAVKATAAKAGYVSASLSVR